MSYQPLAGVKVLDLGILIPAALTSGKLAALGAEVVKVEQPPNGDRLRVIPPIGDDGESPQHMSQSWARTDELIKHAGCWAGPPEAETAAEGT